MSWNLPDGCTGHDVDMAAPGYHDEPEPEDGFDLEVYKFDLAFEVVAEAQAAWSAAVFTDELAIPRKPLGREMTAAVLEVLA